MCHRDVTLFQPAGPCLRVSGRGKYDFNPFFHNDIHDLLYLGIHQRNIYPKRSVCGCTAFTNMFTQNIGIHRTGAYQPQTARITDSRGKPPATTPHHTALNNGILNTEKRRNSVHSHIVFEKRRQESSYLSFNKFNV